MKRQCRAPLSLLLLFAIGAVGCTCPQESNVDRRGRKIGADVEEPRHLAYIPEQERNDLPAQATDYELVASSPGSTVYKPFEGSLEDAGDIDFLRIPAQPELSLRTLRVAPITGGGDLVILWGRDAHRQNVAPAGVEEVIRNLSNGSVLIGVTSASGQEYPLKYQVSLSRSASTLGIEVEPGPPEGLELSRGEVQGLINHAGDTDIFYVDLEGLPRNGALRLEFQPPPETTLKVTPLIDGQALTTLTASAGPEPNPSPVVWPNLRLDKDAKRLEVRVVGPETLEGASRAYTLRSLLHAPIPKGQVLETEPNDPGSPIHVKRATDFVGYLHHPEDVDVFTVSAETPDRRQPPTVLHVRLEGKGMDWSLELDTPKAQGGKQEEEVNISGAGKAEIVCNRLIHPGETRLLVRFTEAGKKASEKQGGNPTLGRYRLRVEARPAEGEEIEPNEDKDEATKLRLGDVVSGFLYPRGDRDLFKFEVKAPPKTPAKDAGADAGVQEQDDPYTQAIEVNLSARRLNLSLEVIDEDGLPVAQSDAAPAGAAEKLALDLPAGAYFLRVKAGPRAASCEAPYTLSLNKK